MLEPVDEVVVTTLVDNVYDALLDGDEAVKRAPFSAGTAEAPQFESGVTTIGLMAEHGFSALVTVRRDSTTTSMLFDTGLSPDAMVTNARLLGIDTGRRARGRPQQRSLRRLATPGSEGQEWPTFTTDFEHGMPPIHQRWSGSAWEMFLCCVVGRHTGGAAAAKSSR